MRFFSEISVIAALLLILSTSVPVYSQDVSIEEAEALNRRVVELYRKGQYANAITIAKKVLAIRGKIPGAGASGYRRKPEQPGFSVSGHWRLRQGRAASINAHWQYRKKHWGRSIRIPPIV